MPIQLRPKARAQAVRPPKRDAIATVDWLALWGLSLGFCAIVLAGIADFVGHDNRCRIYSGWDRGHYRADFAGGHAACRPGLV